MIFRSARHQRPKVFSLLFRSVATFAASALLPIMAAEDEAPSEPEAPLADLAAGALYPGVISGGVKGSDAYVDGHFSIVAPAWSTLGSEGILSGDLIFIEPYISWGQQDEMASSLGIGWRHLFGTQSINVLTEHDGHQAGFFEEGLMMGANVFVDMLDTHFDNRFWQFGFGVEAVTRYLEFSANYYLPLSNRQVAEEIRTRQRFTTRSSAIEYHEPSATGYSIYQDVTLTRFATTTTIERLFRRYEDGMEGWDSEVALLVPWIDRWMDVKLIGGYYAFDNQPFGPQSGGTGNVKGWKAGVEVRPVPAVVLTAAWYDDERLTGSDWIAGVSLEVPFEAGDLGDGKGFWGRISDAFKPRRRHLVERMAEPVRRQNAAVKIASSMEEDKSAAEAHVVTKVVSQSTNRIVLATTVVFVDNVAGSPSNPGTYERPLSTVQDGENRSGTLFGNSGIVFVQGRDTAYVGGTTVSQSTAFYGSGRGYPAHWGMAFHGRTRLMPTVESGFVADGIGSLTVDGFIIGDGVFTQNVGSVKIVGNVFEHPPTDAIDLIWTGPVTGTAYIADNVIQRAHGHGMAFLTDYGASASIIINGNAIWGAETDGILVSTLRRGVLDSSIQINGSVSNTIQNVGTNPVFGGYRYSGGATGQFIINNTIINSFPPFP
jgi:hypothetical protein